MSEHVQLQTETSYLEKHWWELSTTSLSARRDIEFEDTKQIPGEEEEMNTGERFSMNWGKVDQSLHSNKIKSSYFHKKLELRMKVFMV